jgi:hypothetical protein
MVGMSFLKIAFTHTGKLTESLPAELALAPIRLPWPLYENFLAMAIPVIIKI